MSTRNGGEPRTHAEFLAPSPAGRQLAGSVQDAIKTVDRYVVEEPRFVRDTNSLGSSEFPSRTPHIVGKVYCSTEICGKERVNEALAQYKLGTYQTYTTDCGQCWKAQGNKSGTNT